MDKAIISDTSCLIALERIGKLDVLKLIFEKVLITEEVRLEFGQEIPDWIAVVKNQNTSKFFEFQKVLDSGEASSIAFALGTENSLLIIDEVKGRKIATENGLEIIGTLGLLLLAKKSGLVEDLEQVLKDLNKNGSRVSKKLIDILLG
jgi:predicted nucleic acid-binding protein